MTQSLVHAPTATPGIACKISTIGTRRKRIIPIRSANAQATTSWTESLAAATTRTASIREEEKDVGLALEFSEHHLIRLKINPVNLPQDAHAPLVQLGTLTNLSASAVPIKS